MASFPEEINPIHGYILRFGYEPTALEYLQYFKVIDIVKRKFIPLDLTFNTFNELKQFLYDKAILGIEVKNTSYRNSDTARYKIENTVIVVDTKKIHDVEESISKYLLNFKYYTVNQVADMLSMSRPTVYRVVNDKTLKSVRINGQIRINHLDLANFINRENQ